MNKNILRDILILKMEILSGITGHLPAVAKVRIDNLQHEIITAINEVTNEYLGKKMMEDENKNKHIRAVQIE